MNQTKAPERFYKADFCEAVCGYTYTQLREFISEKFVTPADSALEVFGRDMPRDESEEISRRYEIFMGAEFRVDLLDVPTEKLYEAFIKFKDWEEHVHPRPKWKNHEDYWGSAYSNIENVYNSGDEDSFKKGIVQLVNMIIHD